MDVKYAYYPGCSLEATAGEYDRSVRTVCAHLGIELQELPDWSCCGASSGHSTNRQLAQALAGRNLALAERVGLDMAVACPACYLQMRSTCREVRDNSQNREELVRLIDMPYEARYDTRHLLDIIYNDIGLEELKKKVVRPLEALPLVSYYGCYLVRPPEVVGFDDSENPQSMDKLLAALGAEVKDWSGKVNCCGGGLSLNRREIASRLVAEISEMACRAGAQAMVTACPLCHSNLEMRQADGKQNKLPVFYFTELIGLAVGIDEAASWMRKHLISPSSLLASHDL
ncbi:MAG: heterodisulfide reductase subunit B [Dehalococcoidales bacterium]|mgnify:CR=1 FL=1|nr:heterodisulfide reductase subunit B [Dehalococcoidales bacterium]